MSGRVEGLTENTGDGSSRLITQGASPNPQSQSQIVSASASAPSLTQSEFTERPIQSPRHIAPLGSATSKPRPRSKTPTQREPNPNSPSFQSPPSFQTQIHSPNQASQLSRGRDRPKTWAGRSRSSIERRPLWNPSSPVRPPTSPKSFVKGLTVDTNDISGRERDFSRGRSLSRSPRKGRQTDSSFIGDYSEEENQIALSNLHISIEGMDSTQPSSSSTTSTEALPSIRSSPSRESTSRGRGRGRGRGTGGSRLGPLPTHSHQDFTLNSLDSDQHQHNHSHQESQTHSHDHPQRPSSGKGREMEDHVDSQDERDQEKERAHFLSVLEAFDQYLPNCLAANSSRRRSLYALPRAHRALLEDVGSALPSPNLSMDPISPSTSSTSNRQPQPPLRGVKARLDGIDDRIRRNADVLNEIVKDSRGFLGDEEIVQTESSGEENEVGNREQILAGKSSTGIQAADSSPGEALSAEENVPASSRSDSASRYGGLKGKGKAQGSSGSTDDEPSPSISSPANLEKKTSNSNSDSSGSERAARHEARKQARERLRKAQRADYGVDKIRSTLKQFVRDWSSSGSLERASAYGPIIRSIEERFGSIPETERNLVRILVPGAGLGRLAFELAWRGFSTQGNEFSFYMLLASHFVLNKTKKIDEHSIYPYVHSSSNWRNADDMLKEVRFPDVKPSDLPHQVDFSMVAGEFIEVYSSPSESQRWDVVTTCFFIDTARNFIRYLEVFNHILPLGGLWINLGPLLWHYEGGSAGGNDESEKKKRTLDDDISIELTLEEVLECTRRLGFEIEEQRSLPEMPYTGNPSGMLVYQYKPEFWVARKVAHVNPAGDA